MRSGLKYTILTIVFSLLISQAFIFAQTGGEQTKSNSGELNIEFPNVEAWDKSKVTRFPRADQGYMVNYTSEEGGRITAYVYTGGQSKIPSGIEADILKEELKNAEAGIFYFEEMGYYQNVKKIKDNTVTLGGKNGKVKSLHSLFGFSANGNKLTSEIFLFGYKNHFIKFRATRPQKDDESDNKALAAFWKAMDELFAA